MSDAGKAFRTYLQTKSGVTNLISTRMYPDNLPENHTLPCAVYYVISDVKEHHLGGAAALATVRIQVDCYAATRTGANALAEAIRDAADGYSGAAGDERFQTCHLETQRYDTDTPADGSDLYRYLVSQDWMISLTESAPSL